MTLFFIIAIALLALILGFALHPLWQANKRFALIITTLSVLLVTGLYMQFGKPEAIGYVPPNEQQELDTALAELAAVVQREPNNLEARLLLARTKMQLGQYREAQKLFAEALKQQPANSNLMVDYAESLFRDSTPTQINPQAQPWIDKALALDPRNQRALFFKGILLLQDYKPKQAADVWQTLLPELDEATAQALLPQLNQARQQAGLPALALSPAKSVSVQIDLDQALKAQTPPGSVLFVFAKSLDGAGPPIAAKRIDIGQFPITVTLSDADSIMPTAKLFSQSEFSVTARISASGTATVSDGDWQSEPLVLQSNSPKPSTLILRKKL